MKQILCQYNHLRTMKSFSLENNMNCNILKCAVVVHTLYYKVIQKEKNSANYALHIIII